MAKTAATRDAILSAGLQLISRRGVAGAGLGEILRRVNVPKGSFYHYFPGGKEAFVLAVIERYVDGATEGRRAALSTPSLSPLARLRLHFDQMAAAFAAHDWGSGCLLGNLAGEAADDFPAVRTALNAGFEIWARDLAATLEEAQRVDGVALHADPLATARLLVAGWEGAVLMMKSEATARALDEFIELWFGAILRPDAAPAESA